MKKTKQCKKIWKLKKIFKSFTWTNFFI